MIGCGGVALERCSVSAVVAAVALAVAMWRGPILYCFYKVLRNWHIFWLLFTVLGEHGSQSCCYLQWLVSVRFMFVVICSTW